MHNSIAGIKAKDPNKNSLGSPVGMVASSVSLKGEGKQIDIAQARYATCLKAFARLYLNPEITWTSVLLDTILQEGLDLCLVSGKVENNLDSPLHIYSESEKYIQREFQMSDYRFHIELMEKFKMLSPSKNNGAEGDGLAMEDVILTSLKMALRQFFRQHKHCLVTFGTSIYVMIWRCKGAYFVLDVCGRRLDFHSDREKGMAMLVCLKTLENVRHLLIDLTNLQKVQFFNLREIKMVNVVMPSGETVQRDYGTRIHEYRVVNDDYAYLKATLHLTLNKMDVLRSRSALPAGVVAMVLSKIDHPATWNTKMLDKILCYAFNFCQRCWHNSMMANEDVDLKEFPSILNVGQFRIEIELKPQIYVGSWRCIPGYNNNELFRALENAFSEGYNQLLIQINFQMYALWRKQNFTYLLDPYRHRIHDTFQDLEEREISATLRMFRSWQLFMNSFHYILLDSNRSSKFYIHNIKIKSIQQRYPKTFSDLVEEQKLDSDIEIKSLNEHICFEEADHHCHRALADISDYEDEDLISLLDELELKTSSSEGEEGLEEEETRVLGEEEEEMEGLETSSSGEDQELAKNKGEKTKSKKTIKKNKKGNRSRNKEKKPSSPKKSNETNKDPDIEQDHTKNEESKHELKDNQQKSKKIIPLEEEKKEDKKKNQDPKTEKANKIDSTKSDQSKTNDDRISGSKKMNVDKDLDKNKNTEKEKSKEDPNKDQGKEKPFEAPPKPLIQRQDKQVEANLTEREKDKPKDQSMLRSKNCHKDDDGAEADDEHEDDFFTNTKRFCFAPNVNRYPGYYPQPLDMAVVGSENGSYESLSKLLQAGFQRADRILTMTPWGNFVIFRCINQQSNKTPRLYYLFDGCTCNVNRFRHLDLTTGTAGLLCFHEMHDVIEYMRRIRKIRSKENRHRQMATTAAEICREYCG